MDDRKTAVGHVDKSARPFERSLPRAVQRRSRAVTDMKASVEYVDEAVSAHRPG